MHGTCLPPPGMLLRGGQALGSQGLAQRLAGGGPGFGRFRRDETELWPLWTPGRTGRAKNSGTNNDFCGSKQKHSKRFVLLIKIEEDVFLSDGRAGCLLGTGGLAGEGYRPLVKCLRPQTPKKSNKSRFLGAACVVGGGGWGGNKRRLYGGGGGSWALELGLASAGFASGLPLSSWPSTSVAWTPKPPGPDRPLFPLRRCDGSVGWPWHLSPAREPMAPVRTGSRLVMALSPHAQGGGGGLPGDDSKSVKLLVTPGFFPTVGGGVETHQPCNSEIPLPKSPPRPVRGGHPHMGIW